MSERPGATDPHGICIFGLDYIDQLVIAGGDQLVRDLRAFVLKILQQNFGNDRVRVAPSSGSFIIMLQHDSRQILLSKIRQTLTQVTECRVQVGQHHFSTTAHAGLVWAANGTNTGDLTRMAAAACAVACGRGVDLVEYNTIDNPQLLAATQSAVLMSDARSAMEESRLILHAQQIVDLEETGPTRCYEILVKMRDRDGREQSPSMFLPLVERTNMICIMDDWIIREAILGHAAGLQRCPEIHISLNMSGRTLSAPELWRQIDRIIAEAEIDPARIQFEVTETSAIYDAHHARANVSALRELGCSVALDDFGAGLSGFSYLTDLKVNQVKIDGGLVANVIYPERREAKIVEALVGLCRELGLEVVGEHVSSREIFDILREFGITKMQGYFTGMPVLYESLFVRS